MIVICIVSIQKNKILTRSIFRSEYLLSNVRVRSTNDVNTLTISTHFPVPPPQGNGIVFNGREPPQWRIYNRFVGSMINYSTCSNATEVTQLEAHS